ncbi:DUF2071 domain-containing protein [Paenibacillus sp. GD4]|uniref:YqjF family protein n=1 Tax=Paenibacillus sp. GD4 TaxID=3068890 RepID=UPI00279677A8|nr:DUF2071 domain-containing protein [Paenibacillus sp. GD4]MDQ1912337.1 DUF2071 domain-containing protein [Paenibacillus sp. GD4]
MTAYWDDRHRPWPVPDLPWIMKQTWNDLLFAHWPIRPEALRRLVPGSLPIDTYDGWGWIGVVPFDMTGIRMRGMPPIPLTDRFPELNVRTYVTIDGKPGVYFFSLDAANWLAVKLARAFYHLPYIYARMEVKRRREIISYKSVRANGAPGAFQAAYRPISDAFLASPGSIEEWLTERYCLYTLNGSGQPCRCDILHPPWPLRLAEAEFFMNTMTSAQGIAVEETKPLLHFASTIDVRIWPLLRVRS